MRQKRDCDVITLKIIVQIDLGRAYKSSDHVSVCVWVSALLFVHPTRRRSSAARRLDVRRPGGWTSTAPAAGRPPPQRLDVRRPSGSTSAALATGRPPPRWLDVRRPSGWTSAAPAAGCPPPRRLDVRRPDGWTSAAPMHNTNMSLLATRNLSFIKKLTKASLRRMK